MINNLSTRITEQLISSNTIKQEDRDLYIYGIFMLLSQLMFILLTVAFGFVLNCVIESIVFYIAFQFIRRYAGGYHAKTEARCEIMSTLSIFACLAVIRLSKTYDFYILMLCLAIVAAILIAVFCPLDTPEKPLSEKEFKYFRKISWIILSVITIAVIISFCFRFNIIFAPCCMSLILESILLIAGKIKRIYQDKQTDLIK